MPQKDSSASEWTRRSFLQTVGAGVPTLRLMAAGTNASAHPSVPPQKYDPQKFTPIELTDYFTASPEAFGPREEARRLAGSTQDGLLRTLANQQSFRGIPFLLGPDEVEKKRWIVLSTRANSWTSKQLEIPLQKHAGFVCVGSFCDWDEEEKPAPGKQVDERIGQHLADAVLIYEDGSEKSFPIRRRFEVNAPSIEWGHLCYAALPHLQDAPRKLTDPLADGTMWGELQYALDDGRYPALPPGRHPPAFVWVWPLANPQPERTLKALRFEAASDDPLVICGLTLYHGRENPLRIEALRTYRITLPEPTAEEQDRWRLDVDLGVVARTYVPDDFNVDMWLSVPARGLGERNKPAKGARYIYAEIAAHPGATLTLGDRKTGRQFEFELAKVSPGEELEARTGGARVEILDQHKVWVHGQVVDSANGLPTPVRLAFRSKEGRYIPPYGHRADINDGWFQDYGADVKLMDTSFAYVDGTFQVELPVGEILVEMTKGFEYSPVRQKLDIRPDQRELKLQVARFTDLRSQGWVTADTHVHFLSPSTAILEGQAEGLNLVNLLAAQWGDLFTNVGDLPYGPLASQDKETVVWVSTENRQHILGHMGLLGVHGEPVYPMSASGPGESYLGDPLRTSLTDWAEECRKKDGLAISVHFPYPAGEVAAQVVLGKTDALELFPNSGEGFNNIRFVHWYRVLNCGYRLPVVGGTDKMGAYMPVGANRTYAYLNGVEFDFPNWAKAVRKGNTFVTSGPLILFRADGRVPGEEIAFGAGGGAVEVHAEARCFVPLHRVEVVLNGQVVAAREEKEGAREILLKEKIQVPGSGWIAARCFSRHGPTTAWGFQLLAHTSPIYVRLPGQEVFSAPAAAFLLTLIEGAETWIDNLATRSSPDRMDRARQVLREARERLHRRMHQHGIPH